MGINTSKNKICIHCDKEAHPNHGTLCFSHAIKVRCILQTKYNDKKSLISYDLSRDRTSIANKILVDSLK